MTWLRYIVSLLLLDFSYAAEALLAMCPPFNFIIAGVFMGIALLVLGVRMPPFKRR